MTTTYLQKYCRTRGKIMLVLDMSVAELDMAGSGDEKMEREGNQKFSDEAIRILQRLYSNGMTGWGKDYHSNISIAITTTGLTLNQIKVCSSHNRICLYATRFFN